MPSGLLAHGTWIDDLAVPLLVAGVFGLGVLRASAGAPDATGACPYCAAPAEARIPAEADAGPADVGRCGRCGFRLGARLSPSAANAPEEGPR